MLHRKNRFAARQGLGEEPGPPSRVEMHRMEIALGTSSLAVWTEELMVVFRDCVDHVDYMSQANKGAVSRFCTNACPPAHSFVQEYATEGLAGPTCPLRHVTWPDCMPGHTARLPPASPAASCLSRVFPSVAPTSDHLFLPTWYPSCPNGAPSAKGSAEITSHPWAQVGMWSQRDNPRHLPSQGPGGHVLRDELVKRGRGVAGAGNPDVSEVARMRHPAPESGIFSTTSERRGWLPSQVSRP